MLQNIDGIYVHEYGSHPEIASLMSIVPKDKLIERKCTNHVTRNSSQPQLRDVQRARLPSEPVSILLVLR